MNVDHSLWIVLLLTGVLLVNAALLRRRRRDHPTAITDFVAAELVWIDGPPTMGALGSTANSRAVVRNAEHQTLALTPTYTSLATGVATVSSAGVVTAVSNGTATIQASYAGVTSITQTATVSQVVASITGVSSTLSTNDLASGTFTPVGKDANNNTVSGATFAYAVDFASILSVNASTGAWAGQSAGTAHVTITASPGGAAFVVTATVAHVTYTLAVSPNPITGATTTTVQLTVTEDTGSGPVDVTSDAGTVYSTADKTKATIDAPTLTSISPTTITQGTNASYTFTGTNVKGTETIGGLPTGVTASSYVYTSTTVVCTLAASAFATTGAASLTLVAGRGDSGSQTLTVASSGGSGTLQITSGAVTLINGGIAVPTITDGTSPVTGYSLIITDGTKCSAVAKADGTPALMGASESGSTTVIARKAGYTDSAPITVTCSGGLFNHLDAQHGTGGVNPGDSTNWVDGVNATTFTSATPPQYRTGIINGKPGIHFASGQYLSSSGNVAAQNPTVAASWFGAVFDSLAATQRVLDNQDNTAKTGYRFRTNTDGTHTYEFGSGTATTSITSVGASTTGTLAIVGGYRDASGFPRVRVNGVETVGGTAIAFSRNTTSAKVLGAINNISGFYEAGSTIALLEYSRIPTTAEVAQIENAINYWGGAL